MNDEEILKQLKLALQAVKHEIKKVQGSKESLKSKTDDLAKLNKKKEAIEKLLKPIT